MSEWAFRDTNIYFRPNGPHKVGEAVIGDVHTFDHITFVSSGAYHFTCTLPNGVVQEFDRIAGQVVLIRKDVIHTITCTQEPGAFVCMYGHKTPQGENCEYYDGNETAYV